jgi:predicted RNase H-like HicB family nuclease
MAWSPSRFNRPPHKESSIPVETPTRPNGRTTRVPKAAARVIAALSAAAGDALQRVAMRYGEGGSTVASTFEFTIKVEPDQLDGGFIAECVELPGCMSEGETEEEALDNIANAITSILEIRVQDQLRSPESKRPGVRDRKISVA